MRRKGNFWDNAPMESFFGILKTELVHRTHHLRREAARRELFALIEGYYNRQRLHSAFGCLTPELAELQAAYPDVSLFRGRITTRHSSQEGENDSEGEVAVGMTEVIDGRPHPPKARLALRVGVTGHRPNKLGADHTTIAARVHEVLSAIKAAVLDVHHRAEPIGCYRHDSPLLRVVSPLAEGADRIVAVEGAKLGFELQVVLPFAREEYERDFETEALKTKFRELLATATVTLTLDGTRVSPAAVDMAAEDKAAADKAAEDRAYRACGLTVLRQCDVLIAIWDGQRPESGAGTGAIVAEALRRGLLVVWIDTRDPSAEPRLLPENGDAGASTPDRLAQQLREVLLPAAAKSHNGGNAFKRLWRLVEDACTTRPHQPPDLRAAYFAETQPTWTLGWLYPFLRGVISLQCPQRPSYYAPRVDEEHPWEETSTSDQESVLAQTNTRITDAFGRHYVWADRLSNYYANAYRSAFMVNDILAAIAILFAILVFVDHDAKSLWIAAEIVLLSIILGTTLVGRLNHWHERWLDYRMLAEQLRLTRFAALFGRAVPLVRYPPFHGVQENWVAWHLRAIEREAGLMPAKIDPTYLNNCRELLRRDELEVQINYHTDNAELMSGLSRNLHVCVVGIFLLTLLIGASKLLSGFGILHEYVYNSDIFSLLAGWLPALAGAFHAMNNQGEFRRIAERSLAMADALRTLDAKVGKALAIHSAFAQLADEITEVMSIEHSDWHMIFGAKHLDLPA